MGKVFGYVRVSTETQSEKGYGLAAQEQAIRKYASENGLKLSRLFLDSGISGNLKDTAEDDEISKREGLIDMLASLEAGDVVIVLNTSRLWRSDMTRALVKRELMKRETRVISIEYPKFDLYNKDPNDYLINSLMEALDVYDRMAISLKLARGRTVKAKGGDKPAGVTPFGYRYTEDKIHIEVNIDEASIVKRIFNSAMSGISLAKIAAEMNKDGLLTRKKKKWTPGSLSVILNNRFYIGTLIHNGKMIQGNHDAIISKVVFGKVQSQLSKRQRNKQQ